MDGWFGGVVGKFCYVDTHHDEAKVHNFVLCLDCVLINFVFNYWFRDVVYFNIIAEKIIILKYKYEWWLENFPVYIYFRINQSLIL